jgi:hypothetical protein
MKHLPHELWTSYAKKHADLVGPYADAFLKRRSLRQKHPVHDFLFTYYNCSPQKLKQWVPPYDKSLEVLANMHEEYAWINESWFEQKENSLYLDRTRINPHTYGLASFVATLCTQISTRPSRFGCFGLHEWAMVYKSSPDQIRHNGYRLRLSPQELADFVESQIICCTHYDAYRFFTKEAHPLNTLNPRLETRLEMEQGGCLHANMDVYKWSVKLWPWIGSDFIARAFFLALEGRELDMRASPYDLTDDGYAPLCIETEEGRRQYQKAQQLYAEKARPLRIELAAFCEGILATTKPLDHSTPRGL